MMQETEEQHYAHLLMIEKIRAMAEQVGNYPISEEVLEVMAKVPRHRFVPSDEIKSAYVNHPLPVACGQTISQPYIVALMTELLRLDKRHKILEIGTGTGYQSAILAELAGSVYSVEIIDTLARKAASKLEELAYRNVHLKIGDGNAGWLAQAPFDGIIVTAAAHQVPQALLDQLKAGGRMVIPVGYHSYSQELLLISKTPDGTTRQQAILPVSFVPLSGGAR